MSLRTVSVLISAVLASGAIALAPAPVLAEEGPVYEFTLTKRDKKALRAQQKAASLTAKAAEKRRLVAGESRKLELLRELIDEAESNAEVLQSELVRRVIERYQSGSAGETAFMVEADSLAEAADRAEIVRRSEDDDAQIAEQLRDTQSRLINLELALEQARAKHARQAVSYEERAAELSEITAEARDAHMEADTVQRDGAGIQGSWFAAAGDFNGMPWTQSLAAFGGPGLPYDGGSRTPSRPATPMQIARVVSDPRIDVYAGGREDILQGRIDGRVLDALTLLADRFGSVTVTSLISGHGVYTSSGNVSEHTYGCAADIGSLGGIVINSSTQGPGSVTENAVKMLASLTGDLAPHQVISLLSLGGPTLAMADHNDHIHLGYSCS